MTCRATVAVFAAITIAACGGPPATDPNANGGLQNLAIDGEGIVADRNTAELWVRGNVAYTTTWGSRTVNGVKSFGNAVKIWNVSGSTPVLVDSLIVSDATTTSDIQVSDDGKLLVVSTEPGPGSIVIYDLTNTTKPVQQSRFSNEHTNHGVHTAEVQRVNGRLYAFLCTDPGGGDPAKLVIVDITNPVSPVQVFEQAMGAPFVHDVYVRDGILMTALWNNGMSIFDIGGGGKGGSLANPVLLGNVHTLNGQVHNIWWFHDPLGGSTRYAFVGEEGPGSINPPASSGDIHVVDVSDFSNPHEVAFYHVAGAGPHNFSMDESNGLLYSAYYNAGVRVLNVRGDLAACTAAEKSADGRCDLAKMGREVAGGLTDAGMAVYVWGIQFTSNKVYASDMLNGLWKLEPAAVGGKL